MRWLGTSQALGSHAETLPLQHARTTYHLQEARSLRASVIFCMSSIWSTSESARCSAGAAGGRRQALCEDGHGLVLRERLLVVLRLRSLSEALRGSHPNPLNFGGPSSA